MENKQISPAQIDCYLKEHKNALKRYESAFKALWPFCKHNRALSEQTPLDTVAGYIMMLHKKSPNQARNAYSGLLLVPGMEHLRFNPLLKHCKKFWNSKNPKYQSFWDAEHVMEKLLNTPLPWDDPLQIRNRLILSWRLLMMARSIDLARAVRTISVSGGRVFILWQRKGWQQLRWEQVLRLDSHPHLCPTTLLLRFVALTSNLPGGSALFQTAQAPHKPLTANTLGSITKKLLTKLGVDMSQFGPHSTRGAGVKFWKKRGLLAEQVAEMGQWKNLEAFQKHYLRLDAVDLAQESFSDWVHTVSHVRSAEPDRSSTPGTATDQGGSDLDGEAQETCEPNPPTTMGTTAPSRVFVFKTSSDGASRAGGPVRFTFLRKPRKPYHGKPSPKAIQDEGGSSS